MPLLETAVYWQLLWMLTEANAESKVQLEWHLCPKSTTVYTKEKLKIQFLSSSISLLLKINEKGKEKR